MRRSTLRTVAVTLAAAGLLACTVGALVVAGGLYDVSAGTPHTQAVYSLLELTKVNAVRRLARSIDERPLDAPLLAVRGAVCFREHCAQCHGAPGVAPDSIGLDAQPLPGPLTDAAERWRPREMAWIVSRGIRLSGMPAWGSRLGDDDIWALVAYLRQLPTVSPAAHRTQMARTADQRCPAEPQGGAGNADPERGRQALERSACRGCHTIPGVVGSQRNVGPPLAGFGRRTRIAGKLANTPENLSAWIQNPQRFDPASAMPAVGTSPADARDMAAYLGSLR